MSDNGDVKPFHVLCSCLNLLADGSDSQNNILKSLQELVFTEFDASCIHNFLTTLHNITEKPRDTREISRARLSEHMFASGTISTIDAHYQPLSITLTSLFDSGNLIYSFISQAVIDRHPELKKLITVMSNVNVILGDGKTHSSCNTCLVTDIVYNVQEKEYKIYNITLVIMPALSTDIIIGLPDIVKKASKLFMKLLTIQS